MRIQSKFRAREELKWIGELHVARWPHICHT